MTEGGSSIPEVQALLTVLATGKRVAEAGTAFGEGAKALARSATSVVTVEIDPQRAALARETLEGLTNVECFEGDWRQILPAHAPFELVFVDSTFKEAPEAQGRLVTDLLVSGGLLVIDDMVPDRAGPDPVREFLFGDPHLHSVEIRTTVTTSAIISARRST